ncbi:MAG: hypothetical protein OEV07_12770 [Gammaproteobacteria bacterium]|nr:hypothetical protein [Gammaproteobacteria bacterium]
MGSGDNRQNGYVLLLTLLALMGIGGVVVAGFTQDAKQQVEHEKYLHNKRVLAEAKQALLQFAYNYPATNQRGPGRLPCADTDNDGTPNTVIGTCIQLGRLPWGQPDLNLYDIRDADGQRLWYAVSDSFATNVAGGNVINSDAFGTITIRDQVGNIIFDGSTGNGVAAVIIAPGAPTARAGVTQDRSIANADDAFDTTADTDPGIINPVNYLDLFFGIEDNAQFAQSATNGFILGRVDDLTSASIIVNDQFAVITAAEVIEVAEKATLQAYRNAFTAYDLRIDNDVAAGDNYPWLYNYAVNDLGGGYPELDDYPSDPVFATEQANFLGRIGRVPSIYSNYFIEAGSQPIESELQFDFSLSYPVTPTKVGFDQLTPIVTTGTFDFNAGAQHVFSAISTLPQTISFNDIADVVGDDGRLSATAIVNETFQVERWFWDENALGPATGIWTICPAGGDQLSDCNRDAIGNPTPGSPNNLAAVEALRVIAEIDFPVGTPVNFDMDYTNAPVITATSAADGGSHATIQGVYLGADMLAVPVTLSYEIDRFYLNNFDIQETGTLVAGDMTVGNVTLGLRYYPELPDWAFSDAWYDSIQMAYASDYLPGGAGGPCTAGTDCLQVENLAGGNNDKISILAIAGQHDWVDEALDNLSNDVSDVFDLENDDIDDNFDVRALNGNDKILVVDEL